MTEEPLICGQCNNKLSQLANFKESVISNEFRLQCHQKTDLEAFLETLTDDTTTICRLCLKAAGVKWKLTNNWQDNKQLFSQCNIHMVSDINYVLNSVQYNVVINNISCTYNISIQVPFGLRIHGRVKFQFNKFYFFQNVNVAVPTKICNGCCVALQKMGAFISLCTETENLIADWAGKKGRLSFEDLLAISMEKSSTSKKTQAEDINNDLSKAETIETIKGKSSSKKSNSSSASIKEGKHAIGKNNSIMKYMTPNKSKKEAEITKLNSEEVALSVTRTPNTYQKKKSKKRTIPDLSADMPSTSQAGLSTVKLTDRKFILKKMNEQLRRLHTSIDTTPVSDLTDITLDANNEGLMLEEPANEFNVTQELIDVLEGRLNDKEINFATQELLDVLEGRSDDTTDNVEGEIVVKVEVESIPQKEKAQNSNSVVKKDSVKAHSKLSKAINITDIVSIPRKKDPKSYGSKSKKVAQSSNSTTDGLKQGTIITSFKNILAKNKESIESDTVNENPDGTTVIKKTVKKPKESNIEGATLNNAENKINKATEEPIKAKRNNKTMENGEETAPPKKRVRKAPKKIDNDDIEPSSQNPAKRKAPQKKAQAGKITDSAADTEQSLIVNKEPLAAKRKTYQRKEQADKAASGTEPVLKDAPSAQNPGDTSDDEFVEEINKKVEDRNLSVTIIKSQKKTKKAELDKTWQELTGKPVDPKSIPIVTKEEKNVVELPAMEKRRRGRPP